MEYGPRALIDLAAVAHNLRRVRRCVPDARIMAVVKANGYGHGAQRIMRALGGADALAVARMGEALSLRGLGYRGALVVLEGCYQVAELHEAARSGLTLVVHSDEQIRLLTSYSLSKPLPCWLKVDTGMHRLGVRWDRAVAAHRALAASPGVCGLPGLMTHLANADDPADPFTVEQMKRLLQVHAATGGALSVSNSAGVLAWPQTHGDWVRPGIMLYGISPILGRCGSDEGLRPAMTLVSRLIAINPCEPGDAIGYGATWRCCEPTRVGVVACGYGDGYPRHAPSGTPLVIRDRRVPLVGRVSMDLITVDLGNCPEARVGDLVVLWGEGLPAELIAVRAGTIAYELVCGLASRVEIVESTVPRSLGEAVG
jgi:alanine racemase